MADEAAERVQRQWFERLMQLPLTEYAYHQALSAQVASRGEFDWHEDHETGDAIPCMTGTAIATAIRALKEPTR